ncbi:MAG TPA: phosphoglycerate dehydrogenase [Solirubrobacteraceae bacterium]|nr:phosphoglycerate dehydrogenase [Solirubrobacteraceae bacterium]
MSERVLVAEAVGESGLELLKVAGLEVDLGGEWSRRELEERIGDYVGLLVRSATQVDAPLIARAEKLRAIARAGVGIDNIDVAAATKRGIIVANAPRSNIVTAAEHTMALLLALARNIPQAHGALIAGRWERKKFTGTELMDKTLGVLGFGRIGQLVAARARAFGMNVVAYDPYVASELYENAGVVKCDTSDALYAQADFITVHLPNTPETNGWLGAAAFSKMRDGVRILNVARGSLIVDDDLKAALDAGKVAGAALDVFRSEPMTDHPLFGYPNVIVTPHLGASTTEATDRAGYQAAEQIVAALLGGSVTTAVNAATIKPEDMEELGPFLPLCRHLGRLGTQLALCSSIDAIEVECLGRIAERDTRPLVTAVLLGVLQGRTEEPINEVNAHAIADERGIRVSGTSSTTAHDFTDLVRVSVVCGSGTTTVAGTTIGNRNRPHLLQAWGQRFNLQLEPYLTLFRYVDRPGVIGKVGTFFGERGFNIGSAAVGHTPSNGDQEHAVMILTTDGEVPQTLIDELIASADYFLDGRTVALR